MDRAGSIKAAREAALVNALVDDNEDLPLLLDAVTL